MVVVNQDKNTFKERLIQDEDGKIVDDKEFTQEPVIDLRDKKLKIEDMSSNDKQHMQKVKEFLGKNKEQMSEADSRISSGDTGEISEREGEEDIKKGS